MRSIVSGIYLMIFCLSLSFLSCRSSGGASAAMKRIEDTKAEKAAEVQKQYDAAVKHHQKIQSKTTRKQMKKLEKQSKDFNRRTKGK